MPKNQHQQQQHNMAAAAMGSMAASYGGFGGMGGYPSPGFGGFGADMSMLPPWMRFGPGHSRLMSTTLSGMGLMGNDPNSHPGNRTVYLGVSPLAFRSCFFREDRKLTRRRRTSTRRRRRRRFATQSAEASSSRSATSPTSTSFGTTALPLTFIH